MTTAHETFQSYVKNVPLQDSEGKHVAVKYFSNDWPANNGKLVFEKAAFAKILKTNARVEAEIVTFQSNIVVYKFVQVLHFFVTRGTMLTKERLLRTYVSFSYTSMINSIKFWVNISVETPSVIAGKVAIQNMDGGSPLAEQARNSKRALDNNTSQMICNLCRHIEI